MMKKRGIQFWLDSGTLLGAYRNGKMIPHDFDIDLSVFGEDDLNAAHEVLEAIKPDNYHVRPLAMRNAICYKTIQTREPTLMEGKGG
ncbi:hypothetical protein AC249_AIPGENE23658 [Exaiptasia diaphana]|nr:hypothetical protein AC249_AIPGENE14800 [Exaiptasia diaphana]KXJ20685.1 hypothetical protein AC249_AIPGENE23658 [Exaiptasia diaphana]